MGSVCFKVEKDTTTCKINKVLSRIPEQNSGHPKQTLGVKKNVLAIRKSFIVRKPASKKSNQIQEAPIVVESVPQPTELVLPVDSLSQVGAHPVEYATPIDCGNSAESVSLDSWMQEGSPRKRMFRLVQGLSVFKGITPAAQMLCKGASIDSKATSSTISDLHSASEIGSINRTSACAPQTLVDLNRVLSSESCEQSPKSAGSTKLSQVCKVRKELKRLALGADLY